MNKEKIIGLSNRLNSIVEEANTHPHGNPGRITWDKAIYAIEALSEEANLKPVMSKIFDEWYKNHEISGLELDDAIEELHRCMEVWELGYASNIGMWISKNPKVNYRMCIEALMNGYEVSDDYGIENVN